MPSKNKKKIRKILSALAPSQKGELMVQQLKEDTQQFLKDLVLNFNDKIKKLSNDIQLDMRLKQAETPNLAPELNDLKNRLQELEKEEIPTIQSQMQDMALQKMDSSENLKEELDKKIEAVRKEFKSRLSYVGGGNANRNILVGSNSSTLSRYTDLNIKPGSNVTLTYTNNDNLKTTDLTVAATGGAGLARSVVPITVSSIIGAIASTDQVFVCSQGVRVQLPTAVGDLNQYTVKNTSASSVMIATTGGQTIDTSASKILLTQFTAIEMVSDGSNWNIT